MNLDDYRITPAAKEIYEKVPAAAQAQGLKVASIDEFPTRIPDGYTDARLILSITEYEEIREPHPIRVDHIKVVEQLNPSDFIGKEHLVEILVDVLSLGPPEYWKDNKIYMDEMTLDCVEHAPGWCKNHQFVIGYTLVPEDILDLSHPAWRKYKP